MYITYNFSIAIGPHVYGSWNIIKQKKIEKVMQCPSRKSLPLWYGGGFFLKKDIVMHLLFKNVKNTHFFNEISSKKNKSLNGPKFNSCISISYTIKKFTQEFHSQP
jgi:hypothetical protein